MSYPIPVFLPGTVDSRSKKEQIIDYLRAFPMSTTVQIGAALEMTVQYVGMVLVRMHNDGTVTREKKPGQRCILWDAVADNDDGPMAIKRPVVADWTPHLVRDPLVASFFGPAPAQVAA